jgi:tetratricopeptide (TPR) repeat protein
VTAGGVRGREAEDEVSRYYYYRGGRCYPNEERVDQVIVALNAQLARRPGKADAARMHYLAGLCCDILGRRALAVDHYQQVTERYRKSPFALRAQQRLDQLHGAAAPR